jgi:molybdopterin/thiamine biosynthesis adenylyltransferase
MILTREQINRYLRHIIIPEISGAGQKKLIESKIFISASNVEEAASLIYYVAALGIGNITCCFMNKEGYEKLFTNINELNDDVLIELVDYQASIVNNNSQYYQDSLVRIVIGKYKDLKDSFVNLLEDKSNSKFIPVIVATNLGWKAFFQTIRNQKEIDCILSNVESANPSYMEDNIHEREGSVLSACLLGTLTAIECVKLCLNIGTIVETPIYFDLLSMNFKRLSDDNDYLAIADNNFDLQLKATQQKINNSKKLSDSKVLIVGTGGLGSPAAFALASIGIGTIGFVDYDEVDISNLNRQIIHSTSKIGMSKVESAKLFIKKLNPDVNTITYHTSLNTSNAIKIVNDYDVVLDCVDNFSARYLLNDACYFANKPLVDAAAVRFCGLIMTIIPKVGPCYRCLFPAIIGQNGTMSCSESGVLGPVPGVMGFIQAAEAVKLLLGTGETLQNRIIYYDALESDFDTICTNKSLKCDLCGTNPTINTLKEYKISCEM